MFELKTTDIDELFSSTMLFMPIMFALLFVSFILYYATQDIKSLGSNAYLYSITIIIPLVIGFIFFTYNTGGSISSSTLYHNLTNTNPETLFTVIFTILKIIAVLFILQYLSKMNKTLYAYTTYLLIFVIIAIGLGIVYNVFINYFSKLDNWAGFFANFIFYIPCLIVDFIAYIKHELQITPNIVFVLFVIEILLIVSYLSLPYIIKKITTQNGTVLVGEPVFLDTKIQLLNASTIPMIQRQTTYDVSGNVTAIGTTASSIDIANGSFVSDYYRNYAISMWIFINPQPSSTLQEVTIFEYDNSNTANSYPKPRITYYNDPMTGLDTYLVYFTTPLTMNYSLRVEDDVNASRKRITGLPNQKWNQFTVNYGNNKADLFVNGAIILSFDMAIQLPTYGIYDQISIGQNGGIDGAICNVIYHTSPLNAIDITNSYNLLRFSNPPSKA